MIDKEVWNIEIELFKEFQRVCNKYNLKFFVDSGTLLGAIRHKGFIPWDDDMDLIMMRTDYEKLKEIAKKEFKKPYFFQNYYTDENYYRGHAQLRKDNTTGILEVEKNINKMNFHQGIFIDIFVLDEIPKYKFIRKLKNIKYGLYKNFINLYLTQDTKVNTKSKRVIKKILLFFFKPILTQKNANKVYEKFERDISKKRNTGLYEKLGMRYGSIEKNILEKELLEEMILVDFENIKVPVEKEYDIILKKYYGQNYIKPKKQNTCHGSVIFDTKKSYKEILKEIRK